MKKYFLRHLVIYPLISICMLQSVYANSNQISGFGKNFLSSLKEKKFDLLKEYMLDEAYLRSFKESSGMSAAQITSNINKSIKQLKGEWQKIVDGMSSRNVDTSKLEFVESLVYNFVEENDDMQAMVIVYQYDGKLWDDLSLVVASRKGKEYLLSIPLPTRAFTFYDETLKESSRGRTAIELKKPEFIKSLVEQVNKLIGYAKENNLEAFASLLVYRGEDENKKWKSAIDINNTSEMEQAGNFMKRVLKNIDGCEDHKTLALRSEKESEGTWIILPLKCSNKTISFAFLKINGKLLLGDIDAETIE